MTRGPVALMIASVALLAGCGGEETAATDLPPAALEGRRVMRAKGCGACHGSNGGGGVGPAFVGLYGSDVPLQSGRTVVADRDYLTESILDPRAELVEGYNLPMPTTELSDDELQSVLAYIEALAEVEP